MRETIFSPCRKYRYTLWRRVPVTFSFEPRKWFGYVQFIGLNPSTADEVQNDPTIRRCIDFASRWGFTTMCMTNLFAWRDTDPKLMKAAQEPIGDENNLRLLEIGSCAGLIVAAWGKDGNHLQRQDEAIKLFKGRNLKLHHLGLNGDGTPKHPLYLKKTLEPIEWI